MKIFPDIIVRIAGGSFDKFQQLAPVELNKLVEIIQIEKQKKTILAEQLNNEIYQLMPSIQCADAQKQILNIKRDVFNGRSLNFSKIESLNQYLTEQIYLQFQEYISLTENINELIKQGEQLYQREMGYLRQKFGSLVNAEKFKQGLLVSSETLLNAIPGYLKTPSDKLRKKEYQTESGLLKYLSRMYAKTSPFSTFTNLAIGHLSDEIEEESINNDEIPYSCHIRVNNNIYKYLKTLLLKNPEIYRQFSIRANPSLTKNEEGYVFLINYSNVESFQSMPDNQLLDLFYELSSTKKEGFIYNDLVDTIIENEYIEAPVDEIEGFINQLIDYGFFEFNIGVSGIDPDWDIKLVEKLNLIEKKLEPVSNLISALIQLRVLANKYSKVSVEERKKVLIEAFELIRSACMKLHESAGLPEEERLPREEYIKFKKKKYDERIEEWKNKIDAAKAADAENNIEAKTPVYETDDEEYIENNDENEDENEDVVFKQKTSTYFYFKHEQIFFEDTSAIITPTINHVELCELTDKLHKLCQILPFSGLKDEQDIMTYFFIKKYGKEASIDLFRFYEDYFREYKKPEAERKKKLEEEEEDRKIKEAEKKESPIAEKKANIIEDKTNKPTVTADLIDYRVIPSIRARYEITKIWQHKFAAIVKEGLNTADLPHDEIRISLEQVQKASESVRLPAISYHPDISFGTFIQFFKDKDKLKGVLNASFPGNGKMISRFLHLFDDTVTENVRKWNEPHSEDYLFLENCDASFFNANLHPCLMPNEIWMPGGQNTLPSEKQIPITEIKVEWNEVENQLQLTHSITKKRIYIFDLGFQGSTGRSELFKMLIYFTNVNIISVFPLINSLKTNLYNIKNSNDNDRKINIFPRIVYENNWILQRKEWLIPKELLILRNTQENDFQYYLKLNEWKEKNKLPDDVFVYANYDFDKKIMKKDSHGDDRKPQYISFKNPLLIDLFSKISTRTTDIMKIVEMFPVSDQMLRFNGEPYVTECVVQWYT